MTNRHLKGPSAGMVGDTIKGIPRVDPRACSAGWKRAMQRVVATRPGAAVHRSIAARLDTPIMKATGGRVTLAVGAIPVVVLTTTGARSGQRRETPLAYFTDGDDVILTASNYGGARHPGWYHNLLSHPECELHLGQRGGRFVARDRRRRARPAVCTRR
jgi:deazaflavin-dependent oxidoreductase (nitroreductase family)